MIGIDLVDKFVKLVIYSNLLSGFVFKMSEIILAVSLSKSRV